MKKSLIALAVAGAFAAPAFAASSNVDIYGQARVSINHGDKNAGWTVSDQVSRVGIKGSEDLGGGMKAIWQWESQLNNLDNNSTAGVSTASVTGTTQRNTFIGLAGGFGTVLAGTHDSPYKLAGSADIFGDTAADSQKATSGIIGRNSFDTRANNATAYISPDWSGFHFAIAGFAAEEGAAGNSRGLWGAQSLALVYANGPLKVTGGWERYDKEFGAGGAEDKDAYKLNAAYKIGDVGLGLTWESSDPSNAAGTKKDKGLLASITYGMGPITLGYQYGKFDDKNGTADLTRNTVGAYYALSKRTQSYLAYNKDNNQTAADAATWTVGLNHSF
ncbi:MAG: porin [Betaproteobacteria bacterium]|nr:porin [Betaproteobacteria bacterium]